MTLKPRAANAAISAKRREQGKGQREAHSVLGAAADGARGGGRERRRTVAPAEPLVWKAMAHEDRWRLRKNMTVSMRERRQQRKESWAEGGRGSTHLLDGPSPVVRVLVDQVVAVARGDGDEAGVEGRGVLGVGRHDSRNVGLRTRRRARSRGVRARRVGARACVCACVS